MKPQQYGFGNPSPAVKLGWFQSFVQVRQEGSSKHREKALDNITLLAARRFLPDPPQPLTRGLAETDSTCFLVKPTGTKSLSSSLSANVGPRNGRIGSARSAAGGGGETQHVHLVWTAPNRLFHPSPSQGWMQEMHSTSQGLPCCSRAGEEIVVLPLSWSRDCRFRASLCLS
jgi:hypothetical protein